MFDGSVDWYTHFCMAVSASAVTYTQEGCPRTGTWAPEATEIVLAPKDQSRGVRKLFRSILGGAKGVAVSYDGNGTTADESLYQILDASDQEMGLYTLVLRVRDNISGRTAETEQDLFLEQ